MRPEDLAEVLQVWVASWQNAYPDIDFDARREWMTQRLEQHQRKQAQCLVAVAHEKIVGLLVINRQNRYLDQLAVDPAGQGSGIAELLLDAAKRLSPSGFGLHVNQDNGRAIRFYAKHGLERLGEDVNPRSGAAVYHMGWRP